jgi:hypothetical protein
MGIALLYDLLRPARQRCPGLVWLLDGAYCLLCALGLGLFLLRQGDGELRLYILLGTAGGGVLFFGLLSESLRSVWEFWTETILQTGQILAVPLKKMLLLFKKTAVRCKNLFYFAEKYYTIRKNGGMGNLRARSGGREHGKKQKEAAGQGKSGIFHKNPDRPAAGGPDVAVKCAAHTGRGRRGTA